MKSSRIILFLALLLGVSGCGNSEGVSPDGQVINQLKEAGSNLSKEHPVEFFIYAPSQGAAEVISRAIAKDGFISKLEKSADNESWLVYAVKNIVPSEDKMISIRNKFEKIVADVGGEYGGWGTPIVK